MRGSLSSKLDVNFYSLREGVSSSNRKRSRENLHASGLSELEYPRPKNVVMAKKFGIEAMDMAPSVNASQRQLQPGYMRTWFRTSVQVEAISQPSKSAKAYKKRRTSSRKSDSSSKGKYHIFYWVNNFVTCS